MTSPMHGRGPIAVTGAGSGIGAALAGRLVTSGHRVIGIDRSTSGVPDGAEPVTCDRNCTNPTPIQCSQLSKGYSRLRTFTMPSLLPWLPDRAILLPTGNNRLWLNVLL